MHVWTAVRIIWNNAIYIYTCYDYSLHIYYVFDPTCMHDCAYVHIIHTPYAYTHIMACTCFSFVVYIVYIAIIIRS